MRKVLTIWSVLFLLLWGGGLLYGELQPPPVAEHAYENGFEFRLLVTGLIAAAITCVGLFVTLFFGSIARSLLRSRRAAREGGRRRPD